MTQIDTLVDARGHRCPVPTLRLARALERAQPQTVVRLLADDPMARIDVPHYAAERGYEVIDMISEGPTTQFRVRKS